MGHVNPKCVKAKALKKCNTPSGQSEVPSPHAPFHHLLHHLRRPTKRHYQANEKLKTEPISPRIDTSVPFVLFLACSRKADELQSELCVYPLLGSVGVCARPFCRGYARVRLPLVDCGRRNIRPSLSRKKTKLTKYPNKEIQTKDATYWYLVFFCMCPPICPP